MKILFFILLVSAHVVNAQKKAEFHSQNYAGVLEGEHGSKFQLQSINGMQWRTWFAGIGTGIDYYYFRSVPLFLSFNKFLCSCNRSFFFSLDGGVNWVWDNNTENNINWSRNGDFAASPYWGTGIGYKIGLKNKKDAVLLNIGYSQKRAREFVNSVPFCRFPPCPELTDVYRYRLNRLSLRVGWQF